MAYSDDQLRAKILEMYPEIKKHEISFSLRFNGEKNAYILDFKKDKHELTTHLEKKDADDCLNNIKCVYLGVQVGQFLRYFEEGEIIKPA
jgi:hypothetical protein